MQISDGEVLARLALAVVLCGAIGLERESRGQAAGLRTHILVGLGSALFTLVSAYAFVDAPRTNIDPTRIAAQIVTGIGFLGAGTIIRQGFTVRGLTTAAALWIVAAIGMAAGAGYYFGAVVSTVIILATLIGFRRLRPLVMSTLRTDFVLLDLTMDREGEVGAVVTALARYGVQIDGIATEREGDVQAFRLELLIPPNVDLGPAFDEIKSLPNVREAEVQGWGAP